jgi:hypothetical protein
MIRTWWSLTGAADHRDAGRRRFGLHPDEIIDHRRPDLSRVGPLFSGVGGHQRRHGGAASAATRKIKAAKAVAGPSFLDWRNTEEPEPSPLRIDLDATSRQQPGARARLVES